MSTVQQHAQGALKKKKKKRKRKEESLSGGVAVDRFYMALISALEQTLCTLVACDSN